MKNRSFSQVSDSDVSDEATTSTKSILGGSPQKEISDHAVCQPNLVIDEEDEVCLLEVPKFLDVQQFIGKSIHFDRRTKLKINKVKYVIEPSEETVKPISLLMKRLQLIYPVASLQLREYIKKRRDHVEVEPLHFKPKLPENLKVRHPLFGVEYKDKIILSEEVERKLDNTINDFVKKMKKKKHKEKKVEKREKSQSDEAIFALLESHSPSKKKKKHKKDVEEPEDKLQEGPEDEIISNVIVSDVASEVYSLHRKKKNKKHKTQMTIDMQEGDEIAEDNMKNKKNNAVNNMLYLNHSLDSFLSQNSSDKKKKSKEHKKALSSGEFTGKEHEERHAKMNFINSTAIPGLQLPSFEFDVSGINREEEYTTEKQKERRKSASFSFTDELSLKDDFHSSSELIERRKKKKKKEKLLIESETEQESSHRKRKMSQLLEDEGQTSDGDSLKRKISSESDEPSPKKKRKKDKEKLNDAEANSLIMNLLSKVKEEIDSKPKKGKSNR